MLLVVEVCVDCRNGRNGCRDGRSGLRDDRSGCRNGRSISCRDIRSCCRDRRSGCRDNKSVCWDGRSGCRDDGSSCRLVLGLISSVVGLVGVVVGMVRVVGGIVRLMIPYFCILYHFLLVSSSYNNCVVFFSKVSVVSEANKPSSHRLTISPAFVKRRGQRTHKLIATEIFKLGKPKAHKKIPHTGDKESLARCG